MVQSGASNGWDTDRDKVRRNDVAHSGLKQGLPNVHSCGYAEPGAGLTMKRVYQTGYHVTLILDGAMWVNLNGRRFVAQRGDVAWFDLGTPYTYGVKDNRLHRYWMRVSGTEVDWLFRQAGVDRTHCARCSPETAEQIERLFHTLCSTFSYHSSVSVTHSCRIAKQIMDVILPEFHRCSHSVQRTSMNALMDLRVRDAMQYIEQNACKNVSVEEIATRVHLSKYHFIRLFKNDTGLSPKQYLLECRLIQVRKLLIGTDLPIGDVAEACGYGSQSYFNRFFQKVEGVTPGEYRRINREKAGTRSI